MTRGFADLDESTAPTAAARILAATRAHLGFVPAAMARMVAAPALATAFQAAIAAFDRTSLDPREREVVILTMAHAVGCEVCVAMHLGILRGRGEGALADALATAGGAAGEARLDALAGFVRSALARHGDVDAPRWEGFLAAGYTRAQALEVMLGLGAYTMSTFANRLTEAPVDLPRRAKA